MTAPNLSKKKPAKLWELLPPWLAVAVWAGVIYYFSAQPSLGTNWGIWDFILRKTAHFIEFAVLCLLLWRAIKKHGVTPEGALTMAAPLSLLYAFSDEYHQSFVTGRVSSIRDVGVDMAGIIAAIILVACILRRRRLGASS